MIKTAGFHEIFDRLLETPSAGVQVHVHADARAAVAREPQDLSLRRRIIWIKPGAHQHFFTVKRPAFDKNTVLMLTPNFIVQMIRDRELQKMSWDSFMTKDRPRIFDRRANIKVFRLRIIGRKEKKPGRIFVVNAGRIHETTRAGWFKGIRQLPNLKWAEIIGQRD